MIIHYNRDFVKYFMDMYNQMENGTVSVIALDKLVYTIYNTDELYEPIEDDDLMWKRLQKMEKYTDDHLKNISLFI